MAYHLRVMKWGSSHCINLPKALKEDLMVAKGDHLIATLTEDHKLIIKKDIRHGSDELVKEGANIDDKY